MAASVQESLRLQLLEMEMLLSMFPNPGEVTLEDVNALTAVRRFLDGARDALPPRIEFEVALRVEEPEATVALQVALPHLYPFAAPQLFCRSPALDRGQQRLLNDGLAAFVGGLEPGELSVGAAVQWLRDHGAAFVPSPARGPAPPPRPARNTFVRLWVCSHRVYQQDLRKKILEAGRRLGVTGFCVPGKPGVVCAEGLQGRCEAFWRALRHPSWRHVSCKHAERAETDGDGRDLRLFPAFAELRLDAPGGAGGLRRDHRLDLGRFLHFLRQHRSEHVFQILFGIESKSADP
ncbi:LOW QUALITY PROTEIN: RWD domain-containing protein 2A [Perognathus longimembris pacificus]|uniref:LOW QUALITY PROTEIN: RWD domain-containing protein 2A n=1 Tax=Perognathus longimembris pacificus TaxID=214514 RepID=UPI0020184555|nr:LOW QUALITY PROTEIN: RWD domain-containing protein 2A [Perognathus longimembris pacificus]